MADERTRADYDDWHDRLGEIEAEEDVFSSVWHRAAAPTLQRLVPGARVLEVACGRGALTSHLLDLGAASVSAADFSPSAVRQTQQRVAGRGADVSVQDIQAMTYDDQKFDLVVSFETIEHVPDPAQAVRELARVLRPGGTLALTTPNYLGIYGLYRGYRRLKRDPYTEIGQPINKFVTVPRTRAWIRSTGLQVDAWHSEGQYFFWPGRVPRRVNSLDRLGVLSRYTGLHSIFIARKPAV